MKQRVRKRLAMEAVARRNAWLWTSGDDVYHKLRGTEYEWQWSTVKKYNLDYLAMKGWTVAAWQATVPNWDNPVV